MRALSANIPARSFAVNAIGPTLVARNVVAILPRDRKTVFAALSSRVSSLNDNQSGGWHAYRVSKASLNMLIRDIAIEFSVRNKNAVCAALHPGTVNTALSRPLQAGVAPGKLFSPNQNATYLSGVIDRLGPDQPGSLIAWDGRVIPF
ncbi:MAG: SDR family oxidoreductase [Alphaproteobacteria bacterium]|nr:SDR family oxidoreductase [Alphaproteobacteria bacterium]